MELRNKVTKPGQPEGLGQGAEMECLLHCKVGEPGCFLTYRGQGFSVDVASCQWAPVARCSGKRVGVGCFMCMVSLSKYSKPQEC